MQARRRASDQTTHGFLGGAAAARTKVGTDVVVPIARRARRRASEQTAHVFLGGVAASRTKVGTDVVVPIAREARRRANIKINISIGTFSITTLPRLFYSDQKRIEKNYLTEFKILLPESGIL
jgi:hypothetical protein